MKHVSEFSRSWSRVWPVIFPVVAVFAMAASRGVGVTPGVGVGGPRGIGR